MNMLVQLATNESEKIAGRSICIRLELAQIVGLSNLLQGYAAIASQSPADKVRHISSMASCDIRTGSKVPLTV